ncbi:uncharacterized protein LOC110465183 [Mizuhopecten yessoensis]|uniref:uncharacterized protein LOC110465183 n=1 Tax=Mizuhopecten yessoensis TaxID=6573 RepID=UPI000B459620|nr:uncharacterized protein LOC110465183 [Mizuhopecten yessoensis]
MRGKGVRKSRRPSSSPYSGRPAAGARGGGEQHERPSSSEQPGVGGPLSPQQLEDVIEQVSTRLAPQLVEAVHQAIEPRMAVQPSGNDTSLPQTSNVSICHTSNVDTACSQQSNNLCNDLFDPRAHQVASVNDELGRNVVSAVRQKIINNEFVDLGQLLAKPAPLDEAKLFSLVNGELVVKGKIKNPKIVDIDMWTDAFTVFISIYTSAHPADIAGLLKYMHTVRLGAKRAGGVAWRNYDEQFRLKKAQDHSIPWGQIDQELWLLFMHAQVSVSTTTKAVNRPNPGIKKCFDFNNGSCNRSPCFFKHICLNCSGNHRRINCHNKPQNTDQNVNSAFRSGSAQPTSFQDKGNNKFVRPRANPN